MQIIHRRSKLNEMEYPVGTYIAENKDTIKYIGRIIKKYYSDKRVNLWCRGTSGAIISSIISLQLNKCRICHIKKEGENSHGSYVNAIKDGYNIIVDDFICSGETISTIILTSKRDYDITEFDALLVSGSIRDHILRGLPIKDIYCQSIIK